MADRLGGGSGRSAGGARSRRGRGHTLALVGTVVLAWIAELLNSAIEALADAVSLRPRPLIKRAKDLGSAAVMLSLLLAAATWAAVFWP